MQIALIAGWLAARQAFGCSRRIGPSGIDTINNHRSFQQLHRQSGTEYSSKPEARSSIHLPGNFFASPHHPHPSKPIDLSLDWKPGGRRARRLVQSRLQSRLPTLLHRQLAPARPLAKLKLSRGKRPHTAPSACLPRALHTVKRTPFPLENRPWKLSAPTSRRLLRPVIAEFFQAFGSFRFCCKEPRDSRLGTSRAGPAPPSWPLRLHSLRKLEETPPVGRSSHKHESSRQLILPSQPSKANLLFTSCARGCVASFVNSREQDVDQFQVVVGHEITSRRARGQAQGLAAKIYADHGVEACAISEARL